MTLPKFDFIPHELKDIPNWVLWKLAERNGKNTKIPYQISGIKADTTKPDTWVSYDAVKQAYTCSNGEFSGIGFVFSDNSGIMGIDWDNVKNGEWDQEALEEITSCGSYAELSQSGTGAHVLIKGKILGDRRRKGNIEMYSEDRFFVVTGQHIEGTPLEITENQEAIDKLYEKRFKAGKKGEKKHRILKMTDEEVLSRCRMAVNSKKFTNLYYKGEWKEFNYPSQSEADYALCHMIAFYTQDGGQIDRLFRESALYRDEWERTSKYTLENVLNQTTEVYGKGRLGKGKPENIKVDFGEVGDQILKENHIFSMRDNGQIYLYQDGVYRAEGVNAILGTKIRDVYSSLYQDKWMKTNLGLDLPDHIPKATTRAVNEVLDYIRAYTHITRESIEANQAKYVNFKNGLFNLETWELEDHNPEIKSIVRIPVSYNPEAECPHITQFIEDVAKFEDIHFLYEWVGYCLTTDVSHQKALLLYGVPGTGKSVFASLLETFVGEENTSSESLQKIEEDKYRAAKLYGKLVNICSDIPSTKIHKAETFKRLVSGLDPIDAENKYQDPFKFKNKAKLTFSANKVPEGPKDPAFYERFCLIEFGNKFRGTDKDDKKLIQKLTTDTELSGFLNLALTGLKRLRDSGSFSYNKTFEETEKEYFLNSNPVAFFMEECTIISDQDLNSTLLYCAYAEWCIKNNIERVHNIEFSRRLNKLGYTSHRENVGSDGNKKITVWYNLRLKPIEKVDEQEKKSNQKSHFWTGSGQDQLNTSCPEISSQPITESFTKTAFGQDPISFVSKNKKISLSCEEKEGKKETEREEIYYNGGGSCPKCDFSIARPMDKIFFDPVWDPVQNTIFDTNNPEIYGLLRTDLRNFVVSRYHSVVNDVPAMVEDFNNKYPGFKNEFGEETVLDIANKLNQWGWKR